MKDHNGHCEVVLGVFGKPNRNGVIFQASKELVKSRLAEMVGKSVGEIGQRQLYGPNNSIDQTLTRIGTLDESNSAGKLLGYDIVDSEYGFNVIGRVSLNPAIADELSPPPERGSFGIRALCNTHNTKDTGVVKNVINLISFDYLPPCER